VLSAVLAAWIAAVPAALPDSTIHLNGHDLRLHFANACGSPCTAALLVFATGDGGWHRKDLDAYKHLVALGYPIVGFDARDYVTHLGGAETTTPEALAADYQRIITAARQPLHLPIGGPVILVGISRGAGLSVVAAGDDELRASLAGVLAGALTRAQEFVKWYQRLLRHETRAEEAVMVAVYTYLPLLEDTPLAVVQSTRDHYLPAAEARTLFGIDSPYRWLQPIEAANHSFGGARAQLYEAMRRAIEWILSLHRSGG
jgi:hypothetical protein